jgi:hypothetical protein
LTDKKTPFSIIARGQGIGKWNGIKTIRDKQAVEIENYPGETKEEQIASRMDTTFQRLRKSEVIINLNRKTLLEINSFTDPVASNLTISNEDILSSMKKYNLSKNQILSALRTVEILMQLKDELNVLAGTYLDRQTAKIVIDRLNNEIAKTKITVGKASFKINQLKLQSEE